MGGHKILELRGTSKKSEIKDVTEIIENDGFIFYSTSPVYGKPEVGAINCDSGEQTQIVAPKNYSKGYKDGSDYFLLNKVRKSDKNYEIDYFHLPNVDEGDMSKVKTKKNKKKVSVELNNLSTLEPEHLSILN